MKENREYKSDVFSMLMEDKKNALEVYNALNGSTYDDPELVEIVTLQKAIALSIRNDAAFIVDTDINFYEHQSTFNPNMPLRALKYYATTLEERVQNRDLFAKHIIKIPTPHFVVFYNGVRNRPVIETMKLSDAYEKPTDSPELELICTVHNINPGKDTDLLAKSELLNEYTRFVEEVRRFESEGSEEPIKKAINECIRNHILEKFLSERGSEVEKSMTIDMRFERREVLIREEEREEARDNRDREKITDMLRRGKTVEEIVDFCGYPYDQVKQVEDSLLADPVN